MVGLGARITFKVVKAVRFFLFECCVMTWFQYQQPCILKVALVWLAIVAE